jgi:ABC-2 type transport system ATP-binding protein
MEEVFRDCILDEARQGRTVLLSSHILSEVEALCDRVSIIRRGRTVESGTLAELRHLTRTSVRAELAAPPVGVERLPGVHDVLVEGTRVSCDVDTAHLGELLRELTGLGVLDMTCQPPTLEELFRRHYADDLTASDGPATPTPPADGASRVATSR